MNRIDRFFEISARGSSVGAEIRGGIVTFIAMACIVYFVRGWIETLIGV